MNFLLLVLIQIHFVRGFTPSKNALHPELSDQMKFFLLKMKNPAMASAVASKLYPASMIGTLGEIYFRTRNEMECPRGAVAGYIAQVATIILSIPMITVTKKAPGIQSFLEVDWLHFIESIMFWASIHVQCMSFRQAVLSVENKELLPDSALFYTPMTKALCFAFVSISAILLGHYFLNPYSWQHTELFGGMFNPPTPGITRGHLPGELSFLTWIFHWSMIIDYCWILRSMWRWGDKDMTGNKEWKLYTILHLPAFTVNGVVMANHLHRDQLVTLKLLHPILVFIGSIATLYGAFNVSRANGWNHFSDKKDADSFQSILKMERKVGSSIPNWDISYSLASIAAGSLLAYVSLYLTV